MATFGVSAPALSKVVSAIGQRVRIGQARRVGFERQYFGW
jgi:hypothetical protein